MLVMCITQAEEIGKDVPDLIVLPEYIERQVLRQVVRACPEAMVVAAVDVDGQSHGRLIHRGANRIDYPKIGTDGRTRGTGTSPKSAVYHAPNFSVGVIICMDIQDHVFVQEIVRQLRAGAAPRKVLCIPADMGSEWFGSEQLLGDFEGVHVAMSNRKDFSLPLPRRQSPSFITDTHGRKIVTRRDGEAISLLLA